jgi:cytochrome c556
MFKLVKFLAATLAIGAVSAVHAQGFMGSFGGASAPKSSLLFTQSFQSVDVREDISKELKLSGTQITKLIEIQNESRQEMMSMFSGMGRGERPSEEQMKEISKKIEEQSKKTEKKFMEVLEDGQKKRLNELWIQKQKNQAILDADVKKELKITDEQSKKADELVKKHQEALRTIGEKIRNQEIDFSEMRPLMEKNNKILDEELGKLLTKEQADKLKEMGGEPFKFVDPPSPFGQ